MSNNIKSNVEHIVKTIEEGFDGYMQDNEYGEIRDVYEYLEDVLDIEYIVNAKGEYLGARILVAFGGPNIWINTRTKQVEGCWWGDSCVMSYSNDEMGIDEAVAELWACR
jgi:hypothetical protein